LKAEKTCGCYASGLAVVGDVGMLTVNDGLVPVNGVNVPAADRAVPW
jgi:hypothetical protein